MTIMEAMNKGMIELKNDNIETPKMKSRLLMQFILNKSMQYVIANDLLQMSKKEVDSYFSAIKTLRQGIPLEHITHQREFMRLNFYVDENVLIPRQDTEILVEEVIKIAKRVNARKILDLCTGSGAIAVSLAKYHPESDITAIDISNEALKIAKKNAKINEVENQITFINSDLFSNIKPQKFDIIISNPPYIKRYIIEKLDEQVKKEPHIALDGGEDGLDFYRKIIKESYQYLKYKAYLCLEIGYDQKIDVSNIIDKEDKFEKLYSKQDLYGMDRVIVAQLK